ncbi:MAG: hypothetical protein HOP23_06755 [Methylococcaceae bacterium]|nr:hypothetical protein [Methylococcaceae bacterium]
MRIISKTLSAAILMITAYYLIDFPTAREVLALCLIAYFICLQKFPNCWLLVVPVFLPLLYLAPYSGRLFFDEFDFLMLITIAGYLWRHKQEKKPTTSRNNTGRLLLFIYSIVYLIALLRGLLPIAGFNDNSFAGYYSNLNSLRIGKGFFWALCLLPIWRRSEFDIPQGVNKLFTTGIALGSIGVFLAVLWEKGVFHDIVFSENRYQLLSTLFDFHSEYRATGLFAEMHTGDAATDGYLIFVLPFVGYFLSFQKNKLQISASLIGILGVTYSILVTFSRGLYLGMGLDAVLWPIMTLASSRTKLNPIVVGITALFSVILTLFLYLLFKYGGVFSLTAGAVLFVSSVLMVDFARIYSRILIFPLFGVVVLLMSYCLMHGMITSKWNRNDYSSALQITGITTLTFTVMGMIASKIWSEYASFRKRLFMASLFSVFMVLVIPSLFGSRMNTRFETVRTDLQGRVKHWRNAIDIMDDNWATNLFGQGIGTFPTTFYWISQQAKDVGGFSFVEDFANTYIAFAGSPDVKLSQRIHLLPDHFYTLSVDVRMTDPAAPLHIRICHRQLIQPFEWNPTCWAKHENISNTKGQWRHLTYTIPSGKLGSLNYYLYAPLVITFENRRDGFKEIKQTLLDIDNFSIRNDRGDELIKNGDFEQGIDHWFAFYDFNHMPWHIKNLWVNAYFDSGLIGLVMLIALISYSSFNMIKQFLNKNEFSKICFIALMGFLCVGCFGSLIDGPRIAFLFYFVLLINLTSPNQVSLINREHFLTSRF